MPGLQRPAFYICIWGRAELGLRLELRLGISFKKTTQLGLRQAQGSQVAQKGTAQHANGWLPGLPLKKDRRGAGDLSRKTHWSSSCATALSYVQYSKCCPKSSPLALQKRTITFSPNTSNERASKTGAGEKQQQSRRIDGPTKEQATYFVRFLV